MSQGNFGSGGNEGSEPAPVHERRSWRRLHTSWIFWAGMILVTAAIVMYVMSDNLAFIPRSHPRQPAPGQLGQ